MFRLHFYLIYVHLWIFDGIARLLLSNIIRNGPLLRMISRQLSCFSGNVPPFMYNFCEILLLASLYKGIEDGPGSCLGAC